MINEWRKVDKTNITIEAIIGRRTTIDNKNFIDAADAEGLSIAKINGLPFLTKKRH